MFILILKCEELVDYKQMIHDFNMFVRFEFLSLIFFVKQGEMTNIRRQHWHPN